MAEQTQTERLREKMAQTIYAHNKITSWLMAKPCEWGELLETTRENFRKQADRVLQACKEAGLKFVETVNPPSLQDPSADTYPIVRGIDV